MPTYTIEFLVVGLGVFMLLWEAFAAPKNKAKLALIGAAGLTVALVLLLMNMCCGCGMDVPAWMSRFYTTEGYAMFFKAFALVSTIIVLLMSYDFRSVLNRYTSNDNSCSNTGEFYTLPIFACAGLMWMASATDLVSIFVSLELVTITFYIMVAYMRRNVGSLEAGVKYLILGALSTGFLVYGIAWLYGAMGTTDLKVIAETLSPSSGWTNYPPLAEFADPSRHYALLFGLSLIILSLGFKVGAAPMQLWIPDVYQGAPTPITAFLSVASKAAGFGVAIAILTPFINSIEYGAKVKMILVVLAAATLLYGNLSALAQTNFKRLLAYSSIAHAGFMIMGMAAGAVEFVMIYLVTYLIMTFAAFFILGLVRVQDDSDEISAFDGLAKRNPHLGLAMTIIMAGMAGVPLTAGFVGKLLMFTAAIGSVPMIVIIIAIISAAAGFYYYFKIIRAIYWHVPKTDKPLEVPCISKIAIIILTVATILVGVIPNIAENIVKFSL